MKKEFTISAKFDTGDFDKQINDMQRKLKDLYAPQDMIRMQNATNSRLNQFGMGGSPMAAGGGMMQARRELDQMMSTQSRTNEALAQVIVRRLASEKIMQEVLKGNVGLSKNELSTKERELQILKAQTQELTRQFQERNKLINQGLNTREKMPQDIQSFVSSTLKGRMMPGMEAGGGAGGGAGGPPTNVGGASSMGMGDLFKKVKDMMPKLIGFAVLGAIGSGVLNVNEIARQMAMAPSQALQGLGAASRGTMGQQVQNIAQGRTGFEQMWSGERSQAFDMARQAQDAQRSADRIVVGAKGALAVGGAAIGGAAGSVLGPLGTAGGAVLGAGIGSSFAGLNERQRSLAMSPFSQSMQDKYETMNAQEMSDRYQKNLDAFKQANPFKGAAQDYYEQNWQGNLATQRQLGLNDQSFSGPGGYLAQGQMGGFTQDQQTGMSQQILGAGGSTRAARDPGFGLMMQRGSGLTNAGQLMGGISSTMGGNQASNQAMIKVLSEAVRLGLDDSQFSEEQRKFAMATVDYIAKSGTGNVGGADRIAQSFGGFVGDNTSRGIQAAQSSYQQYQQISSTTTGARGTMRMAGFLSNPMLSQLSTIEQQSLMQIPDADLSVDNPLIKGAAAKLGKSPDQVIGAMSGINQGAVSRFKEHDIIRDQIRSAVKKSGMSGLTSANISKLPKNIQNDLYRMETMETTELGYRGARETESFALGQVNMGLGKGGTAAQTKVMSDLTKGAGETGRMGDVTSKSIAADQATMIKNFNEMAPAMKAAAESTAAWTHAVREANAQVMQVLNNYQAGKATLTDVQRALSARSAAMIQQQGGKTKK